MTSLSVIAAGVLVRLARGLPLSNIEQLQLNEARAISAAVKQSARSLRALMLVVFTCMGMITFSAEICAVIAKYLENWPTLVEMAGPVTSASIAFVFAFVMMRIFAVISGDVGLVDLQTDFLVKAVERHQAKQFEKTMDTPAVSSMKNPEGYGKLMQ